MRKLLLLLSILLMVFYLNIDVKHDHIEAMLSSDHVEFELIHYKSGSSVQTQVDLEEAMAFVSTIEALSCVKTPVVLETSVYDQAYIMCFNHPKGKTEVVMTKQLLRVDKDAYILSASGYDALLAYTDDWIEDISNQAHDIKE